MSDKSGTIILPANYKTAYNGVDIKWFIGDINISMAERLGCFEWNGRSGSLTSQKGHYWEAWGRCNGKAYQLRAWFCRVTRELVDIRVNSDKSNYYYCEETFKMLTK